ncbi:uncharacterized protein LOC115448411 isoform X2 [Manduca sexta]|nr:uncharacterized protein LOC115448411 isoform X2 [Manduca sexta]XP_030031697.2 uncharacterized protein LOC115448411 isoform X2 [Manduca sexta]
MFPGFDSSSNTTIPSSNVSRLQNNLSSETTSKIRQKDDKLSTTQLPSTLPFSTRIKFVCPEAEIPSNIGPYEVPTQRDIILFIKKTLIKMFNIYHEKALYFLKDIKEATRGTAAIERKCHRHKGSYKNCVKRISSKCEVITKAVVTSLEKQKEEVAAFIEDKVCNMTEMKADPLQLIKILAMEEASLEFALPGFLRLLNSCSSYCSRTNPKSNLKKPLRHMTDQDLVINHFLTQKNYIQLIKGSK